MSIYRVEWTDFDGDTCCCDQPAENSDAAVAAAMLGYGHIMDPAKGCTVTVVS